MRRFWRSSCARASTGLRLRSHRAWPCFHSLTTPLGDSLVKSARTALCKFLLRFLANSRFKQVSSATAMFPAGERGVCCTAECLGLCLLQRQRGADHPDMAPRCARRAPTSGLRMRPWDTRMGSVNLVGCAPPGGVRTGAPPPAGAGPKRRCCKVLGGNRGALAE
jgi:hypothetical protein